MLSFFCAALAPGQAQPASQPAKKEIPRITFKNLSPPYKEYGYFQFGNKYAFQFKAISFNLINAWWLAEASTLVYAGEEFVRSQFIAAGIPEVKFFENQSTQCYVANNDKFAIVAFRGSEIWKKRARFDLNEMAADLKTNIDIRLTDWEQGGKVHRGFKKALDTIWPALRPHIRKLQGKGCKIFTTGHSLGAALATLCGSRYGDVQGVYSFGSPRVGNDDFRKNLNVKIYRIVNNNDIVPGIPPSNPYVHVGELRFIDREGIIRAAKIETDRPINLPRDETYGRENTDQRQKDSFAGFVPAAFRDHVPLLYSIHLWNNIIESRK